MPDFGFNDWIDSQLRNVPLPPGLLARLAESGPAAANAVDEQVDLLLRDVPVPADLESRLMRITRRRRPVPLWRQMGLAATVFLVLGLGVFGSWHLLTSTSRDEAPPLAESAPKPNRVPRSPRRVAQALKNKTAPRAPLAASSPDVSHQVDSPLAQTAQPEPITVAAAGQSLKEKMEALERSRSTLGAAGTLAPLPELDAMEVPAPRGIAPPRAHGYDLLFQLKHGEHPFISPAAHRDLAASHSPLTFRTTSYDLALRGARAGQLPAADDIRVEDFLAGVDYALPPAPTKGAVLHAAGCPSPLGDSGLYLLQLTVQAASAKSRPHQPARLIVVVDTSTWMRGAARWESVERALAMLAAAMAPADRLTLIGFAEQSRVLLEDAAADDLRVWLTSATARPAGSADLAGAIQSACDAIRGTAASGTQRVVFVSAGRGDFNDAALAKSTQALAALADAHIPWHFVRVAAGDDARISQLADQGHGTVASAGSSADLHAVLLGALTGEPQAVAYSASLKISFNPQVVTGYRLLGHESQSLTAPAADPLEVDLVADQAVTNLYELWIKPGAEQIAVAELTWREPSNGVARRDARPIRRGQLAGSFSQSPVWFQQGVMAAKAAEALRGSYYLPSSRPLQRIVELADQVDPRALAHPDLQALIGLVRQAEKAR